MGRTDEGPMVKTVCPTCEGAGRFIVMKAASFKVRPDLTEAPVPTQCQTCDGTGWFDGLVPPL